MPTCTECGWVGEWSEVLVELPTEDGSTIGPDPGGRHLDPPYYCPSCREDSLEE